MTKPLLHRLAGCTSRPLSAYLKALGVLRLVAEQADDGARGLWRADEFYLLTRLDRAELERFFLEDYSPTPVLAPWNGGSGFYPKDRREAIDALAASQSRRFGSYRDAILASRELVGSRTERPSGEDKARFIRSCRARWDGAAIPWLDAAVALTGDVRNEYPALLGTGGNDGRLDYTNNQMQRLLDLIDPGTGAPLPASRPFLKAALSGDLVSGLSGVSIGQFHPGAAGGANATAGFEGGCLVNPWDFVLMLEGSVVLQVATVRRLEGQGLPRAAAPFAVDAQAAGHPSAAPIDEASRGEQWMPRWELPASIEEVRSLFAEGRLRSGGRGARASVDAARAIARLGVAKGVSGFERYGYLQRLGQSNLAVPLGDWPVRTQPTARVLHEVASWAARVGRAARGDRAPATLARAVRRLEGAMMAQCRSTAGPSTERLLLLLAEVEDELRRRGRLTTGATLKPVPKLSTAWLDSLTGDLETRLALAIASQHAPDDGGRAPTERLGAIRRHCLPLTAGGTAFATSGDNLARQHAVVWSGRDIVLDLMAVAGRRLTDGARVGAEAFPLVGRVGCLLPDLARFAAGESDDHRLGRLARAFMALDWQSEDVRGRARALITQATDMGDEPPPPDLALLRLVYLPWRFEALAHPVLDPAPFRLLAAGRLAEAAAAASRRLGALGARPRLRLVQGTASRARRLGASLAIPMRRADMARLYLAACKPEETSASEADNSPEPSPG